MKGYTEIRDIIVSQLGLCDMASYKAYIDQFHRWIDPRIPTQEEVDLLSPDAIDNHAFWQVAEEVFGTDSVSNCDYKTLASVAEANRRNLAIYHANGFTGMIENIRIMGWWPTARVLEIGPGYGAFQDWMAYTAPEFSYWGADCHPKTSGVDQTLPNGRLGEETKARVYDVAISSNVFQHLSIAQRRDYYRDIAGCLSRCGVFMVSMMVDIPDRTYTKQRDPQGRVWCKHYGQFTEVQTQQAITEDLRQYFTIDSVTIQKGGHGVFTGRRRDPVAQVEMPVEVVK